MEKFVYSIIRTTFQQFDFHLTFDIVPPKASNGILQSKNKRLPGALERV